MLRKIISNFFKPKKTNKILLGRWNNKGTEIKNIYANHDHCGDTICKDPKSVSTYIKKEISKVKNNK
tara:strand:+ start:1857 stop:2057 length:201 start_codon:yes stop_codon:yes gene_type:complete